MADIFKNVPGEENRNIEGIKSILNNDETNRPEDSAYMDEAPPGVGTKAESVCVGAWP